MSCLIPKSDDDKFPRSPKKTWNLRRMFRSFKNSDYYRDYYQYHVHYDDYKKQQRRSSNATKSPLVEAKTVHHQTAAAAARAFTSTRERAHVHRSKDEHRERNDKNGKNVDAACEEFIERLHDEWRLERQISAEEFRDMLDRSA